MARSKLVDRPWGQDAQDGLEELRIGKWFGEIGLYSSLACGLSCLRGIVGRDQHHWNGRYLGTSVTRHGQAIGLREPEVRHDEIRLVTIDQRDRLGTGVGPERHVASAPEKPLTARHKLEPRHRRPEWFGHSLGIVEQAWCQATTRLNCPLERPPPALEAPRVLGHRCPTRTAMPHRRHPPSSGSSILQPSRPGTAVALRSPRRPRRSQHREEHRRC